MSLRHPIPSLRDISVEGRRSLHIVGQCPYSHTIILEARSGVENVLGAASFDSRRDVGHRADDQQGLELNTRVPVDDVEADELSQARHVRVDQREVSDGQTAPVDSCSSLRE